MNDALHTESRRRFRTAWIAAGGSIEDVRRTGEERYRHPLCAHSVRSNKRRKDVPAKLLSSLNSIRRQLAQAGSLNSEYLDTGPPRSLQHC